MKTEARLFAGIAVFFAVAAGIYNAYAHENAGKAVLLVCVLMSSLIALYCQVQYARRGLRAQDRQEAEISETAGPLTFFAPRSAGPPVAALGLALVMLGFDVELWLCWIGGGVLLYAIMSMLAEYPDRQYPSGEPSMPMPGESLHPQGPPQDRGDQAPGSRDSGEVTDA